MRIRDGLRPLNLILILILIPVSASAQSEPVFRALLTLQATLEGQYGDEGSEVSRRFAELTQALAGWDRSNPVEAVGDNPSPITAYLDLTRSVRDNATLVRATDTLLRAVQDVIRGVRTQPRPRFPQAALIDDAGVAAPRFPLARYADVFATALRGQVEEAGARMKQAVATDPLIVDPAARSAGMQKAAASLRGGSLQDAISALEAVVKGSPGSSEAHRMLATAAAISGDTRKSVEQFEAALRIRADDERSWLGLADAQADAGLLVDAARTLEKAIAVVPGSGGLRWMLGGLRLRLDQVGAALAQFIEAERLAPVSGRAAVHQAVARAATLEQDVATAAAAGNRRVRANLNDAAAHRDLAGLYTKEGRLDEAFAELAIAAWLDPGDQLTFVTLGQSLMANRRDEDAVAAFERAVALQPDLREARYGLAQALMGVSRRDDAQRHLVEFERQRTEATARERRALDIDAIKTEAAQKSAAGQHAQAVASWKRVIALEPDRAQNYLALAEALVKAGALEESLQFFVKTADLDGVAEVHLRLAEVLARLGRVRESALARETYEKLRLDDFRKRSNR